MQRKKRSLKGLTLMISLELMMDLRQKKGLTLMMGLKLKTSLKLKMSLGLHNRPMRDR